MMRAQEEGNDRQPHCIACRFSRGEMKWLPGGSYWAQRPKTGFRLALSVSRRGEEPGKWSLGPKSLNPESQLFCSFLQQILRGRGHRMISPRKVPSTLVNVSFSLKMRKPAPKHGAAIRVRYLVPSFTGLTRAGRSPSIKFSPFILPADPQAARRRDGTAARGILPGTWPG